LTGRVELILGDVDRLEREQKWPEAQAAAERAEAALAGGEADDAVRRRVAEARRDLAFVARLDRIRQDRAVFVEGQSNSSRAARDYALAFREYWVDVETLPTDEAIARLRRKPALAAPIAAALDDWADARVALGEGAPRWQLLVAVARGVDPDPLRDRLRATWGQPVTPKSQVELLRLARSIEVKAQSPVTLRLLAQTLRGAQLVDAALRTLQDGQFAFPADFFLNLDLGNQLWARKDYAGAIQYYFVAVSLRPDSSVAHMNLGSALLENRQLDRAVAECRRAVELNPKSKYAHCNLGNALLDQGKVDEAVAECRKAIELDPKLAAAHYNLGNALRKQGKVDEAVAEYRKAIELDPKYAKAHTNLGNALRQQGKLDEAVAEYRKAIELDPKLAMPHNSLGGALRQQGKVDEAVAEYRKAIELDPKLAAAHYNLALALQQQGKPDEAIVEYRKAVELDPKYAPAHQFLGVALLGRGQVAEAVAELRQAAALDPNDTLAHYNLGIALAQQGKLNEASAAYRKALALSPDYAEVRYNLGTALLQQGKLDEAIAEYRRAIALKPDYAEAHCNLGHALRGQGQFSQALEELRHGHELGCKHPNWRYPSAEWVRHCQRLVELDDKLRGFLDGKATPASAAERIELAQFGSDQRRHRAAARLYEKAFAAGPKLVDDRGAWHRYNAACAAALAGCGVGRDAGKLDEKEKAQWRGQALGWLRADLAAWTKEMAKNTPEAHTAVREMMRHWQADLDLAGVRGPEALAKLPEAERQEWQKLWDDVADRLKRAQGKAAPGKK
jgi:tetratricopeptide (TPR) repeat protein